VLVHFVVFFSHVYFLITIYHIGSHGVIFTRIYGSRSIGFASRKNRKSEY